RDHGQPDRPERGPLAARRAQYAAPRYQGPQPHAVFAGFGAGPGHGGMGRGPRPVRARPRHPNLPDQGSVASVHKIDSQITEPIARLRVWTQGRVDKFRAAKLVRFADVWWLGEERHDLS